MSYPLTEHFFKGYYFAALFAGDLPYQVARYYNSVGDRGLREQWLEELAQLEHDKQQVFREHSREYVDFIIEEARRLEKVNAYDSTVPYEPLATVKHWCETIASASHFPLTQISCSSETKTVQAHLERDVALLREWWEENPQRVRDFFAQHRVWNIDACFMKEEV